MTSEIDEANTLTRLSVYFTTDATNKPPYACVKQIREATVKLSPN